MKIGIIGAMVEEVSSIRNMMVVENEVEIGQRVYFEGTINNIHIVLTFSRWGKVASSSTTTTLINRFSVDLVIFTGVAGAVDNQLNMGDIVIANGLYQHDMDARPFFDQFQIPLTDNLVIEPNSADVKLAQVAVQNFLSNNLSSESINSSQYSISSPNVYTGLVASGDKFIHNALENDDLKLRHGNAGVLAVEMEGAAVAQICTEHRIPFIVIRVISDKADHSATIDFSRFVNEISSIYLSKIVEQIVILLRKGTLSENNECQK